MMPTPRRRKARKVEKVENLYRTATEQKILPTRRNKSDHACAIRCAPAIAPSRTARRNMKM
jgi:hypothetical protein